MARTLALVGGGLAHIELLRRLATAPISDFDVALFDPSPSVWYDPMVPGVIAGHYEPASAKVNLWALCQRARVRFFETSVTRVDAANQRIYTALGERHFYDLLSLDIGGSTRPIPAQEGAYVTPVKPTANLVEMVEERSALPSSNVRLAVIGGGATAIETILAIAHRWRERRPQLSLITDGSLLGGRHAAARKAALMACRHYGVQVSEGTRVNRILPGELVLSSGKRVVVHVAVLATGYSAPALLRNTDLALANDGSLLINPTLQSISHLNVFAAGNGAKIAEGTALRSIGTSTRLGGALLASLLAFARSEPLPVWTDSPPSSLLVSLGGKRAVACKAGLTLSGNLVWRWKDWADRRWIRRYAV